MAKVNQNFDNLVPNYLFAEIAKRVNRYVAEHPDNHLIRLGIGDVTLPLAPVVVEAMKKGCDELGCKETFKGYPDYEGYGFLREAISGYYKRFGVTVDPDSLFDVQVKRLHEYKRQHLNALHILHTYLTLKDNPNMDFVPRTYLFGAKSAPGYHLAKEIIRFICCLAKEIDNDRRCGIS